MSSVGVPDAVAQSRRRADEKTVLMAMDTLEGRSKSKGFIASIAPFLGPAFIAAIAYVDPGNFATNIQSGAKFGYNLLWVIVASNLMALLIQALSAKLGIATGRNLAQLCRDTLPKPVTLGMWVLMELVAMATDLAEFLGASLGFTLLFHIPLAWGAVLAAIVTFAILFLEKGGFRPLEIAIGLLLGVVATSYVAETILDKPHWQSILHGAFTPAFQGTESILLAAGILGATVMPHAIFLHSGLTQGRVVTKKPKLMKRLFRYELIDCAIAMGVAGFVNGAMLIMSASTFHRVGMYEIASIEQAHRTLAPLLGAASSWVFAISLLASGLSSTTVGIMAGQVMMEGFTGKRVSLWVRRAVTMAPTFLVVAMGLDPTRTLVISQVVLSFALPFALVPLVSFTSSKRLMGPLVNSKLVTLAASLATAVILVLNGFLLNRLL